MTPETQNPHTSRKRFLKAGIAAVALAMAGGGLLYSYDSVARDNDPAIVAAPAPSHATNPSTFSFADMVEKVSPAVVAVIVEHNGGPRVASDNGNGMDNIPAPFRDFFRQFGQGNGRMFRFGQGQQQMPRSEARGSGFIIDPTGYIVTNNHVVDGGDKITVKLADGREMAGHVVGTDKDTDIALVKLDGARNLPVVQFEDDRNVRVGDWVVAVGNPFGLGGTVTAGIVSYIGRDIGNGPYTDYMQIDAPINQGNSGGPTFDLAGRVVGMNTAIFSPSGGSVGIGFAIPASTIQTIVTQLKEHGSVARGWLGVQIQSLTPDLAASIGEKDTKGAIVASVVDGSPAMRGGLRQGDVIVALDGRNVEDSRDLTRKVAGLSAGTHADFTVLRDGRRETVAVTIGKRGEQTASADTPSSVRPSSDTTLGMQLAPLDRETREQYGVNATRGVVITRVDPESNAADKGLHEGDVIVSVAGKEVRSPADVRKFVAEAKEAGKSDVLMLVDGEQGEHFLALKVA